VFRFRQALGVEAKARPRVPERERPEPPETDLPDELLDAPQFREQFAMRLRELRVQACAGRADADAPRETCQAVGVSLTALLEARTRRSANADGVKVLDAVGVEGKDCRRTGSKPCDVSRQSRDSSTSVEQRD
jgi:hypothetical protein